MQLDPRHGMGRQFKQELVTNKTLTLSFELRCNELHDGFSPKMKSVRIRLTKMTIFQLKGILKINDHMKLMLVSPLSNKGHLVVS